MTNQDTDTWMEPGQSELRITEYEITASSNDFNVTTITNFIDEGSIRLPPYQRNFTWDKRRASKLIESLIIGLPVPQIFLYEEGRNKFSILDGQQRLMSIFFFWKKRFPKKNKRAELRAIFSDKGVYPEHILSDDAYFEAFNLDLPAEDGEAESPLHERNFSTLEEYQSQLKLRPVRCVILKQNEPKDDNSSVFEMFDRLNTGGVNLKPQEIRANLYYSDFYAALYEINKNPLWRRIIDQQELDNNLRDVELVLRAYSMLCYSNEYRPSMTRFLNRFSSEAKRKYDTDKINFLKDLFERFLKLTEHLEPNLFKLSGRFSIAVFEAAFYGSAISAYNSWKLDALKPITSEMLNKLSQELQPAMQEGTSKKENVQKRLKIATEVIG